MNQLPRPYRTFIFERDDYRCRYCYHRIGECCDSVAVDHVDPNGPTTFRNTVCACIRCNGSKKDRRLSDEKYDTVWWREKWVVVLNPGHQEQYLTANGVWVSSLLSAVEFDRIEKAERSLIPGAEVLTFREAELKNLRLKIPANMPKFRVRTNAAYHTGTWYGNPPCNQKAVK